jgi:CYTH domain-containing protein
MRRLAKKADVDAHTRLITSIYLTEAEFALFAHLPGETIQKTRHYVEPIGGVEVSVDRFEGRLEGLIMAEAEFDSEAAMHAFPDPDFAIREVTADPRYGGGQLAVQGLPAA